MNEAERTDVQLLIRAALDFIEHMRNGWDVDAAESEELCDRISDVLRHVYASL